MEYMRLNGVKIETWRPFLLTGWNFLDLIITLAYVVEMLALAGGATVQCSWPLRPFRLLTQSSRIQIVVSSSHSGQPWGFELFCM